MQHAHLIGPAACETLRSMEHDRLLAPSAGSVAAGQVANSVHRISVGRITEVRVGGVPWRQVPGPPWSGRMGDLYLGSVDLLVGLDAL